MTPLVSVNITTYNRAHLLPRCLDSVLSQSYRKLEIVVVDDSSNDQTEKVIEQYQKKDQRIKYYRHEVNKGNASARNTALEHCSGYYVAFMDDDDEWIDKDKIQKQVDLFENVDEDIAIICSNVVIIDKDRNRKESNIEIPKNLKRHILGGNGIIHNSTVLTKKSIMEKVGGFDTKMLRGVDSEFFRQCIVKYQYDVVFMEDVTSAYHAYGEDRMTPVTSFRDVNISLKINLYLFIKYKYHFIRYPSAFVKRIEKLVMRYIKMVLKKPN